MKAASFFLVVVWQLVKESFAYQVAPDQKDFYKNAIEKTLQRKVERPAIMVVDDDAYSPLIPPGCKPAARPLSESIFTKMSIPARNAKRRKRWGIDEDPAEYWFNNKIHTFGNTGFFGALHAAVAPLATKMIDTLAYKGLDVRKTASMELSSLVQSSGARVLDLCCGVGISTRALQEAFADAEAVIGLDTSPEMISMARYISQHYSDAGRALNSLRENTRRLLSNFKKKTFMMQNAVNKAVCTCEAKFARGNAERTKFPDDSFDVVTVFYAFHEAPMLGRYRILREARRLLHHEGILALIDISPDYSPGPSMLAGEPYVLEYKKNIHRQMCSVTGFRYIQYKEIVPGHVGMWLLSRNRRRTAEV